VQRLSQPQFFGASLSSMDDPNALRPECHIWVSDKVEWINIDDGLPQYPEWAPA
jgi:hypothetical protein